MIEQTFSARRCRDTRKPRESQCPDVVFYRCESCGALFLATGGEKEKTEDREINCCGKKAKRLVPISLESAKSSLEISYQITGGYNDNAVKVSWKAKSKEAGPEWIYLRTFTGGCLKYVDALKRSPVVFALADTDAFAYCDENPCLECVFRCKRGFIIYVYGKEAGLIQVPLDKMNPHWQSGAEK
ncbi:MAG: hypothetical protein HFG49_08630 [Lachnospiraceae bacterium]|jgi:hypothetical protein|nr:hypothetical protein [Lachnospiraceae bacterium]